MFKFFLLQASPPSVCIMSKSSIERISTVRRAESYRIPGQRHPTVSAATFALRRTGRGRVMDILRTDSELRDRVLAKFAEEVASLDATSLIRQRALERGRRLLTGNLDELERVAKDMADASSHRAFCRCAAR